MGATFCLRLKPVIVERDQAWMTNFVRRSAVQRDLARIKWILCHLRLSPQPQPWLLEANVSKQSGEKIGLAQKQIWCKSVVSRSSILPLRIAVLGCAPAPLRPQLRMMADHASKHKKPGHGVGIAQTLVWLASAPTMFTDQSLNLAVLVCVPQQLPLQRPLWLQPQLSTTDKHASRRSLPGLAIGVARRTILQ